MLSDKLSYITRPYRCMIYVYTYGKYIHLLRVLQQRNIILSTYLHLPSIYLQTHPKSDTESPLYSPHQDLSIFCASGNTVFINPSWTKSFETEGYSPCFLIHLTVLSLISTKQYLGCSTMKYLFSLTNKRIFYWRRINKQQLPHCKVNRMSSSLTNISTCIFFSVITKIYNCLSLLLIQQKDTCSKFIIYVSLEVNPFCFNEIVQSHTGPQIEKRWNVKMKCLKKNAAYSLPALFSLLQVWNVYFHHRFRNVKLVSGNFPILFPPWKPKIFHNTSWFKDQLLRNRREPSWLSSLY